MKAGIIMTAVPFSLIGAVWLLYALGYNISIAVWVGMIALMGLDAETGVFMLLFLDLSYQDAVKRGAMRTREDLREAIVHGAVKRIRPKMMTVAAAFIGLMPIMLSTGSGSDMMKRVVAPMVGGLVTSFLLELLVYPPIYELWKSSAPRSADRRTVNPCRWLPPYWRRTASPSCDCAAALTAVATALCFRLKAESFPRPSPEPLPRNRWTLESGWWSAAPTV